MAKKFDIFISYRRKGGFDTAKHLYDRLTLEGYSVSFDIDTLRSGDFDEALIQRVDECRDFVLILNKEIFDRCLDPNNDPKQDWVRIEIVRALEKKKNIIPFALDGFVFPPNLPPDIAGVARKNALEHSQKNFEGIYSKLKGTFLQSKPKFTVRYKTPLIAIFILLIVAIIGYMTSMIMRISSSKDTAAVEMQAEIAKVAATADSLKKATDSINLVASAKAKALADSLKEAMAKRSVPAAGSGSGERVGGGSAGGGAPKGKSVYWFGNGDESGSIIYSKISGAGLKSGKCADGFKISVSKPNCKPNSLGTIKCSYAPQLTIQTCEGVAVRTLAYPQTFSGSSKSEEISRQQVLDELRGANFSEWVSELKEAKK